MANTWEQKYAQNISGLAKTNNVDLGVAAAMLRSNLGGTTQYQGGGTLDYNTANKDLSNYLQESTGGRSGAGYTNVASTFPLTQRVGGTSGTGTASGTAGTTVGTSAEDYYSQRLAEQQASLLKAQQAQQQMLANQANTAISGVNTQSDKALQDAYIASQKARVQAPQALAAMGYTGGATESSLLGLDTTYQNNRNNLETSRASSISGINSDLANGNLSLASDYYNQLAQQQASLAAQAQEQSNWQKQFDATQSANEKSDYANSVSAYYQDYQDQINKVKADGDPSNDWQVSYLNAARNQKIADQASAKTETAQTAADAYRQVVTQLNAGEITYPQAQQILKAYGLSV